MMACVYGTVACVWKGTRHVVIVEAKSASSLARLLAEMGLVKAHWVDPSYFDTEEVWLDI